MRGFAGGAWHMSAAPRLLPDELPVSGAVAGQQCRRQAVKSIKLNDGGMKLRLTTRDGYTCGCFECTGNRAACSRASRCQPGMMAKVQNGSGHSWAALTVQDTL